jgi:hypothetical protein
MAVQAGFATFTLTRESFKSKRISVTVYGQATAEGQVRFATEPLSVRPTFRADRVAPGVWPNQPRSFS